MALMPHGLEIAFTKSGFTGQIKSVDGPNMTVDSLDSSHLSMTYAVKEFVPGLMDSGEFTMEVHCDPDMYYNHCPFSDAYNVRGWSDAATVYDTITVACPPKVGQTSGAVYTASGFVTAHGQTARIGELMAVTMTFKNSGPVTSTPGS